MALDGFGEDRVDSALLDLGGDEVDPQHDADEHPRNGDDPESQALDDRHLLPGGEVCERYRENDERDRDQQENVQDLLPEGFVECGFCDDQCVHCLFPSRITSTNRSSSVLFSGMMDTMCPFADLMASIVSFTIGPSGWRMAPVQSNKWMEENMFPYYPLGDLKTPEE